jgi:hypothetical protein
MVPISTLSFLIVGAYVVIFSFLWRMAAAKWADRPLGQAMATIL